MKIFLTPHTLETHEYFRDKIFLNILLTYFFLFNNNYSESKAMIINTFNLLCFCKTFSWMFNFFSPSIASFFFWFVKKFFYFFSHSCVWISKHLFVRRNISSSFFKNRNRNYFFLQKKIISIQKFFLSTFFSLPILKNISYYLSLHMIMIRHFFLFVVYSILMREEFVFVFAAVPNIYYNIMLDCHTCRYPMIFKCLPNLSLPTRVKKKQVVKMMLIKKRDFKIINHKINSMDGLYIMAIKFVTVNNFF